MVDCRQKSPPEEIEMPPLNSYKDWVEKGPKWAVDILKILTTERKYRELEHKCYEEIMS